MTRHPIPWLDFMAREMHTRHWIVAPTLTAKMRRDGYDRAIKRDRFLRHRREWVDQHPGVIAAHELPPHPKRAWLIDAARSYAETLAGLAEVPAPPVEYASIALHRQLCGLGA